MGRKRFPVEVRKVSPTKLAGETSHRSAFTPLHKQAYADVGVDTTTAHRLYGHNISPTDFQEWAMAGLPLDGYTESATTGKGRRRDSTDRLIFLVKNKVTPTAYKYYPKMPDEALIVLVEKNISADLVQRYSDAFRVTNNFWREIPWLHIPGYVDRGYTPDFVRRSLTNFPSYIGASNLLNVLTTGAPENLLHRHSNMESAFREWRQWIMAAEGRVGVAKAVCTGNGNMSDVKDWLATGLPLDRIESLCHTGSSPEIVEDAELAELTDEDLEIWASLSQGF